MTFTTETHSVTRLTINADVTYTELRAAFEQAVPDLDGAAIVRLAQDGADWSTISDHVAAEAPHSFLVFASFDSATLFPAAGEKRSAVSYLFGNPIIAETMYRHDPRAVLYAPLRLVLFEDRDGRGVIVAERPSDQFGSLANADVAEVGRQLDQKLADLLTVLGLDGTALLAKA